MSVVLFDVGLGALHGRLSFMFADDLRAFCLSFFRCAHGVRGSLSLAACCRLRPFVPLCFRLWWPCGLADGARWVLSAIAQSRPQPPLVPIFQCGYRTPEGGGGGLRPPIDSGHGPALCATSC